MADKEWEERQKTRQLEMETCPKALDVLGRDDAHDLFTETFNPALAQESSKFTSERRVAASRLLSEVAAEICSPKLAILAVRGRLDAFASVKKVIDDMSAQLLVEKAAET